MSIYIPGISAYNHERAAALLADGYIIAATQEERFTRKKHDADFHEKPSYTVCRKRVLPCRTLIMSFFTINHWLNLNVSWKPS